MGRRTCDDREVQVHFAEIDTLQREHQHTAADHAEVDRLGRRWLIDGDLGASDIARLTARLDNLATVYRRHIALEDNQLFPLARRVLSAATVQEIGREMARRRGLDPDSRARFRTGHCAAR